MIRVIYGLALAGHAILLLAVLNRLHSTAISHYVLRYTDSLAAASFVGFAGVLFWSGNITEEMGFPQLLLVSYIIVCLMLLLGGLSRSVWFRFLATPPCLLDSQSRRFDVVERLGSIPTENRLGRIFRLLPWNESLRLEVSHKVLSMPRLPASMSGLRIAQLSDLHFTGLIGREYFEYVADETQRLGADLIVVTGDLHDTWECRDWFEATLGKLCAPNGVYFILGNHDLRVGRCDELRELICSLGLIYLGGTTERIGFRGGEFLLAGNELPWFNPAPSLAKLQPRRTEKHERTTPHDDSTFRLLLSHSPDQIEWARNRDFDLVLAGHTHGGQICLPVLGPMYSPSRYGIRFASGVFQVGNTVMHVSRGLSGAEPIRIRCTPELACLELRNPLACKKAE